MTGYRSGFVAGDAALLQHYKRFRASIGTAPQDFVQAAATVAWNDSGHVEQRRQTFAEKRRIMTEHQRLGLVVYPGTASLFLWVEVPPGVSDVDYAARCLQHDILIAPGSYFGGGQERFFRVALVPSVKDCIAATRAWPK